MVAVRLCFAGKRRLPHPSNVVGSGVPASLPATGWTFYGLDALHDGFSAEEGSVIECDYYHAGPLLPLSDDDVVATALEGLHLLLPAIFGRAADEQPKLRHASVLRTPQAVSHFAPGAFRHLPPAVSASSLDNLYFAGDWPWSTQCSHSRHPKPLRAPYRAAHNAVFECTHHVHCR